MSTLCRFPITICQLSDNLLPEFYHVVSYLLSCFCHDSLDNAVVANSSTYHWLTQASFFLFFFNVKYPSQYGNRASAHLCYRVIQVDSELICIHAWLIIIFYYSICINHSNKNRS